MIHVIASIQAYENRLEDLFEIYKSFVPKVLSEDGCLMYLPTADYPTDLSKQKQSKTLVTVIEKWKDINAFKAHINQTHSVQFREDIEGIVEHVSIRVLKAI